MVDAPPKKGDEYVPVHVALPDLPLKRKGRFDTEGERVIRSPKRAIRVARRDSQNKEDRHVIPIGPCGSVDAYPYG
ncbi:hypothetical protein AGMMS50267_17980 [Spirochaetia bacterium]|nr:hypothetical protein AGMMS50267_17980 [Spirochaetia bacterium]